ncbi:hypothetical protein [Cellvibrio mixtus]|uniref:hypothetical protein n=1 Tax=Cellvibrio mixtus TaxID=39650 RepID=UPI000586A7EA|nr:hypothetical protein [Cellvibrio mixtus]
MQYNLFISYDLNNPGQNYEKVIERIKSLGNWAKLQKSHWYLDTNYSQKHVAEKIWEVMDSNDNLLVVNSTTNDAYWFNLSPEVVKFLQDKWNSRSVV